VSGIKSPEGLPLIKKAYEKKQKKYRGTMYKSIFTIK